jgi:ABC-type phosphate transport system substrate-binding protein
MRAFLALVMVSMLFLPHRLGTAHANDAPPFLIIVDAANPLTTLDRKFLSEAFLKKKTRWPGGGVIRPVDQLAATNIRASFSERVIERTVGAVRSYWQQRIFAGRDVPPPELESDEAVVKYVLRQTGAVGYVSASVNIEGAKVLRIE